MEATGQHDCRIPILVVEDDRLERDWYVSILQNDFQVATAGSAAEARHAMASGYFPLIIVDLVLEKERDNPNETDFRFLGEILNRDPRPLVLVISGKGRISHGFNAVRMGAFSAIDKPVTEESLRIVLQGALRLLPSLPSDDTKAFMFSDGMRGTMADLSRLANSATPILITGECGVGKGVLARKIHSISSRSGKPFITLHVASLDENLLCSEVFGHERGAFTGANQAKIGPTELAGEGTLLLDDIQCIPLNLQPKFLRLIQDREFQRVGGRTTIRLHARIVATTNVPLQHMVEQGAFREDLYYRLKVLELEIRPLRRRKQDILPLVDHFLNQHKEGKTPPFLAPDARTVLSRYPWPGNIRELENFVRGLCVRYPELVITEDDVLRQLPESDVEGYEHWDSLGTKEKITAIRKAVKAHGRKPGLLYKELGISRTTLWRFIKSHNLNLENF